MPNQNDRREEQQTSDYGSKHFDLPILLQVPPVRLGLLHYVEIPRTLAD